MVVIGSMTNISVRSPLSQYLAHSELNALLVIVCDNGVSGFLGEHSCMDGTPTLRMNEFVLASLASNAVDLGPARTESTGSDLPAPKELKFVVDAKVRRAIDDSSERFDKLVGRHGLNVRSTLFSASEFYLNLNPSNWQVLHYEGYGKNHIKKFKASPDAWAQLVKQLAFHKMFNRPGVTYESAQTRKYQLGRTEVIRSASNETKAWAEAMLDPDQTVSVPFA
jgi:carnitine O-acetyltransferase